MEKYNPARNEDYWRLREILALDYLELAHEEKTEGYSLLYKELAEFLNGGMHVVSQTSVLNERI